jgi:CRP-like cAMP-binding protein
MIENDTPLPNPNDILARFEGGKTELRYRKHQVVFAEGDPAACVFYIRTGSLKVAVTAPHGREAVVAILPPGQFCGQTCLTGYKQRWATVTALRASALLRIEKASIVRALRDNPEFSMLFISFIMESNIRVQESLVDQLLNSTEKRLARLLLLLANYGKEERLDPIMPKISQETLAAMIGTSRTHVNFFMNRFRQLGHIEYKRNIQVRRSLLDMLLRGAELTGVVRPKE